MERMKTFLIYAIVIIAFIILSELVISVGLNSKYKGIQRKDIVEQVTTYQAEATFVNGRVRGTITNNGPKDLNNKFIRIDFFSKRNVNMGTKYIEIKDLDRNSTIPFEVFFKLQDIQTYEISIVEEKGPESELPFSFEEYKKFKIIYWIVLAMFIW